MQELDESLVALAICVTLAGAYLTGGWISFAVVLAMCCWAWATLPEAPTR